jgi:predicted ferric reductase
MIEMPDQVPVPVRQNRPPRLRRAPAYRGLPRSLAVLAWLAIAVILGAAIGATLPGALRLLGATAALAPDKLAWYGVRATGFLAYFAIAGSVLFGLLLSTRMLDAVAHRPVSLTLHKDLALAGVALSALHGLMLLGDHTFAFTATAILVPFASPYAPVGVAIGQLAFYLVAIVTGSFYVRRQIGQRAWRLIHYLTFLGFLGVTAHGIAAGSDSSAPLAIWAYLVPVAAVAFFFTYRVVVSIAVRRNRAQTGDRVEMVGR